MRARTQYTMIVFFVIVVVFGIYMCHYKSPDATADLDTTTQPHSRGTPKTVNTTHWTLNKVFQELAWKCDRTGERLIMPRRVFHSRNGPVREPFAAFDNAITRIQNAEDDTTFNKRINRLIDEGNRLGNSKVYADQFRALLVSRAVSALCIDRLGRAKTVIPILADIAKKNRSVRRSHFHNLVLAVENATEHEFPKYVDADSANAFCMDVVRMLSNDVDLKSKVERMGVTGVLTYSSSNRLSYSYQAILSNNISQVIPVGLVTALVLTQVEEDRSVVLCSLGMTGAGLEAFLRKSAENQAIVIEKMKRDNVGGIVALISPLTGQPYSEDWFVTWAMVVLPRPFQVDMLRMSLKSPVLGVQYNSP